MRRTLFLHVTPTLPVASTPTTLNPADKDATITLSGGNLVATKNVTHATTWGVARGVHSVAAGAVYFESTATYTGTADFVVGIALSTASMAFQPGSLETFGALGTTLLPRSITGPKKNGDARTNGQTTATTAAVASAVTLRHWIDFDAGTYKVAVGAGAFVTVFQDGADYGGNYYWFGLAQSWFPIIGLLRPVGTTAAVTLNFGATPWVYGLPAAGVGYIGQANAGTPVPLRLASRSVVPWRAGSFLDQFAFYDGRISTKSDPTLSLQAAVWTQGGGASGGNPVVGALEFWNGDHALDPWLDYVWRDALAELFYTEGELVDDAETRGTWARAKVDRVEGKQDTIRMVFADALAQLDRPAQANTYGTQAAAGVTLDRDLGLVGTENEGRPLSLCLGAVFQAEPYNVNPAPSLREYQWSDGPVAEITAVYDKCDPFDELTTGVDIRRTSQTDGFRMAPSIAGPLGKVTADLLGLFNRSTMRVNPATDGSFTTWAGLPSTPSGWTRTGTQTAGTLISNAGGAARFQSDGSSPGTIGLAKNALVPAGEFIEIQFTVTTVTTPGPLYFRLAGSSSVNRRVDITAPGLYRVTMQNTGTTTANFLILTSLAAADVSNVVIDDLGVWTAVPILRLSDMLTHLATVRGPLSGADIDAVSVAALAAKFNPRLGFYSNEQQNTLELVRQMMTGFTGFVYSDQSMKLGVGRLEDVSLMTPTLTLAEVDLIGRPTRTFDAARSLSTTLAGRRNASPTDDTSMATSVSSADRRRWSAAFQFVRSALNRVSAAYANADKGEPVATWLVDEPDVRAEVSRVATLHATQRFFYGVTTSLDTAAAAALNPGDVVHVTADSYDLAAGRALLCLGITRRFFSNAVDLVLWG